MKSLLLGFFLIFNVHAQTPTPGSGATVSLSQKDVAEMVLKTSAQAREVALRYEQTRLAAVLPLAAYEWKLTAATGYQEDKTENLARVGNYKIDSYTTTIGLSKSLLTGTNLTLSAQRISQKTDEAPTAPTYPDLTYDNVGVTLEQAIWGNFLGVGDRANMRAAELTYEAGIVGRANDLEDVVLNGLRQFWNTYVAQENFREALAARERYEKLVASVKKKNSFGYTTPGELSQVQAEYEGRIQAVKTASLDYLLNLDQLLNLLELPTGTEISFVVPREIPAVPKLPEKGYEALRTVRAQKLKVQSAQEALTYAQSKDRPLLSLVGQLNSSGVDESAESAYAELNAGAHPMYYAGLKFSYSFGDGVTKEDVSNKRAALALEELRLKKTFDNERDKAQEAERKVSATFIIAESAVKQKDLRNKAVQELTRSYNQGRTDISVLIDAINRLLTTEVQSVRALGDYQIALNEWAAARDELIPDRQEEKQ